MLAGQERLQSLAEGDYRSLLLKSIPPICAGAVVAVVVTGRASPVGALVLTVLLASVLAVSERGTARTGAIVVAALVGLAVLGSSIGRIAVLLVVASVVTAHWASERFPDSISLRRIGSSKVGSGTVARLGGLPSAVRDRIRSVPAPRVIPQSMDPVLGAVVIGSLGYPMFYAMASSSSLTIARIAGWYNDFPRHLEVAGRLGLDPVVVPPHPLFHVATRILSQVLTPAVAAAAVTSVSLGVAFWGLHALGRRSSTTAPGLTRIPALAFAAVVLVSESPTVLLAYTDLIPRWSNFAAYHLWNSPTETVSLAATMLLLPVLLDAIEDERLDAPPELWRRLAVLAVMATLAKPAFTVVLLFAMPLYQLMRARLDSDNCRKLATHLLLPVLAVVLVQGLSILLFAPDEYRSGISLEPFAVVREFRVGASGPVYFLGLGVLLLGWMSGGRRYFRDTGVGLSLLAAGLATIPLLLLRETGALAGDGNVAKLASSCWVVVLATSARFIAGELVRRSRARSVNVLSAAWICATAVYSAAALASGVIVWQVVASGRTSGI